MFFNSRSYYQVVPYFNGGPLSWILQCNSNSRIYSTLGADCDHHKMHASDINSKIGIILVNLLGRGFEPMILEYDSSIGEYLQWPL